MKGKSIIKALVNLGPKDIPIEIKSKKTVITESNEVKDIEESTLWHRFQSNKALIAWAENKHDDITWINVYTPTKKFDCTSIKQVIDFLTKKSI